ncbi:hypothetical protein Tco_0266338 [Tanacetum coccineum]
MILTISTQGTHRSTPRAHRTPTLTAANPQEKKRKQIVGESSSPQKSFKITIRQQKVVEGENDDDDSEDRLEPGSHKEYQEYVDDDDDKEKVDEKTNADMGSLETRTEEMQTPILTPPRSHRTILSSDKNITQELTDIVTLPSATTSKTPHSKRRISSKYCHLPGALRRMRRRQGYMIQNMERNDNYIHSQRHDDHQEDDAPPEGEKRVKRHKASKSSKSAKGSSSKHSAKDSTTYISKKQQQQEWDAWVEETVIDEDEVILEDETPKLITEL